VEDLLSAVAVVLVVVASAVAWELEPERSVGISSVVAAVPRDRAAHLEFQIHLASSDPAVLSFRLQIDVLLQPISFSRLE
jgi:hypothetical protein